MTLMSLDIRGLNQAADLLNRLPYVLVEFRNTRWYSQGEVARAVGCHRNTLASFERNERSISYKLAADILAWMYKIQEEEKAHRAD